MGFFIEANQRKQYVLEDQRELDPSKQIRFITRPIRSLVLASVLNNANPIESTRLMIRYGCEGWIAPPDQVQSVLDKDGLLSEASIDAIPANYRAEIGQACYDANTTSKTDSGN
jgi:hypothetical protein